MWENKEKREGMQQEGEERRCETTWRRGGKSREKGEGVKQQRERELETRFGWMGKRYENIHVITLVLT